VLLSSTSSLKVNLCQNASRLFFGVRKKEKNLKKTVLEKAKKRKEPKEKTIYNRKKLVQMDV